MTPPEIATVSAVLIARDNARTLAACLDSLSNIADVVMLDNGSTDDTITIAERYPNVRVVRGEFHGFGPTRNAAAAQARQPWILSIDTDECLSTELVESLRQWRPPGERNRIYGFWRHHRFAGYRMRSRLGREFVRRLYHREQAEFSGLVHEKLVATGGGRLRTGRLRGRLAHDPYESVGALYYKRWSYARPDWRGPSKARHPAIAALRASWRFLRCYLLQWGFIDGWRGFVLAAAEGHGTFLKYVWGYEARLAQRGEKQAEARDT